LTNFQHCTVISLVLAATQRGARRRKAKQFGMNLTQNA